MTFIRIWNFILFYFYKKTYISLAYKFSHKFQLKQARVVVHQLTSEENLFRKWFHHQRMLHPFLPLFSPSTSFSFAWLTPTLLPMPLSYHWIQSAPNCKFAQVFWCHHFKERVIVVPLSRDLSILMRPFACVLQSRSTLVE